MPAEAAAAPAADQRHLYWVDWLRFAAALMVVFDHLHAFYFYGHEKLAGVDPPAARIAFLSLFSLGRQAVAVFFVLSGWLVGGNAIRKVRAGTFDAAAYAADRISRVYVPLIPALLFTIAVLRVTEIPARPAEFVACLFGVQGVGAVKAPNGNSPLWTLSYEIWFYILAGGAAVAFRRGGARWQRFAGGGVAALALGVCCALGWPLLVCWLLGAAGYRVRDHISRAWRPWAVAGGAVAMAAGTVIYQVNEELLPPLPPSIERWLPPSEVTLWMVAGGALLLIAALVAAAPRSRAGRWLERAGTPLAAFSYTLYLTHFPVLLVLLINLGPARPEWTLRVVSQGLGWIAVCMAVALGMYALFERQTPRVRRWLRAKLAASGPPAKNLPTDVEQLAVAR